MYSGIPQPSWPKPDNVTIKWNHHGTIRKFNLPRTLLTLESLRAAMKELLPTFNGQLGYTDEEGDKVILDSTKGLQYLMEIDASKWKSEKVLKLETLGVPPTTVQGTAQPDKPIGGFLSFKPHAQPHASSDLVPPLTQGSTQLDKPFAGFLPFKSPVQSRFNPDVVNKEAVPPTQGTIQPDKPFAGFLFKPPITQPQVNPDVVEPEHFGVHCDNCKTANFKGMRLKCAVCENYDLCPACGVKGVHEEHPMIRIWNPLLPVVGVELSNWLQRNRGELEQIINYKGDVRSDNTGLPATYSHFQPS